MTRASLTIAALMMGVSSLAFAQTPAVAPAPVAPAPVAATPAPAAAAATPAATGSMRHQITAKLEAAGFTDVKIEPESFLVTAKDKAGNPMSVFIDHDSMTVFTTADAVSSDPGTPAAGAAAAKAGTDGIVADIESNQNLSSKLVGLAITNDANEKIGTIKDVAFGPRGVKAYIVGVGGVLGVGDRYVAVKPSAVKIGYDAASKSWHASMDSTAAELRAAPEYKYASNS